MRLCVCSRNYFRFRCCSWLWCCYGYCYRSVVIGLWVIVGVGGGAALASGRNTLRIHAQDVAVRAEVAQIESASAHADANQLLSWLHKMPSAPAQGYVVHGEREASDMLRQRIEHEIKWRALVPEQGSVWPL